MLFRSRPRCFRGYSSCILMNFKSVLGLRSNLIGIDRSCVRMHHGAPSHTARIVCILYLPILTWTRQNELFRLVSFRLSLGSEMKLHVGRSSFFRGPLYSLNLEYHPLSREVRPLGPRPFYGKLFSDVSGSGDPHALQYRTGME